MSIFFIAEIGINHNGDLGIAKKLIDVAKTAGCDAVKFQKRTIEKIYTREELDRYRESPWGGTNRKLKEHLEFGRKEYDEIDRCCKKKEIDWFASAWDIDSHKFLSRYDCKYNKVASPMLTNMELLKMVADEGKYTFVSTGMSTMEEIDSAVELLRSYNCPFELMHCHSSYPMPDEEANLRAMESLRKRYKCKVGYSGHETGLQISIAATAMGATSIERHITLDRAMFGTDQPASLEPAGLMRLVRDVRIVEKALGDGVKRVWESELPAREKLRRVQ